MDMDQNGMLHSQHASAGYGRLCLDLPQSNLQKIHVCVSLALVLVISINKYSLSQKVHHANCFKLPTEIVVQVACVVTYRSQWRDPSRHPGSSLGGTNNLSGTNVISQMLDSIHPVDLVRGPCF